MWIWLSSGPWHQTGRTAEIWAGSGRAVQPYSVLFTWALISFSIWKKLIISFSALYEISCSPGCFWVISFENGAKILCCLTVSDSAGLNCGIEKDLFYRRVLEQLQNIHHQGLVDFDSRFPFIRKGSGLPHGKMWWRLRTSFGLLTHFSYVFIA